MLFSTKSNVSGHLFKLSKDYLLGPSDIWVGSVSIDNEDMIAASAELLRNRERPNVMTGVHVALGTTDPACRGLGYYAELVPIGPLPATGFRGVLKHCDRPLDDAFEVVGAFRANADGTSRLTVTIKAVSKELARECKQTRAMFVF